jgi:hypothetical protein
MRARRQNSALAFPVIDANHQSCIRSGMLYRQLDRLDKPPTFICQRANWDGKGRLLRQGLILA